MRRVVAAGLAVVACLAVSACRDEDDRPLSFEKGRYAGPKVAEPSADAIEATRKRVETQKF